MLPTKSTFTTLVAMSAYTAGKTFMVQVALTVPTKSINMDTVMANVFGAEKNFTVQAARTVLRSFMKSKQSTAR